jgi:hypothetical protein
MIRALFIATSPQYLELYDNNGICRNRIKYNPYELASREIYKLENLISYFYSNGCYRIRLSIPYKGNRDLIALYEEFLKDHRNDSRMVSAGYVYTSALCIYNQLDDNNCDLNISREVKTWSLFNRRIYTHTQYYIEITN